MAKINTKKRYITVEHPNFPEIKVKARVLEPVESMDQMSGFQQYQKVVAVIHPKTGEPIYNMETNELETVTLTSLPFSAIENILANYIEHWEGLEDEAGTIISFKPENIRYLFAPELSITKTRKKTINGITKDEEYTQSFGDHIQQVVNESSNPKKEEETESPKGKPSSKR